jgi:hydroxymethylbilane synthase
MKRAEPPTTLRLGTRGSLLATAQSRLVIEQLRALHPHVTVELVTIKTTGDRITDRPLYEEGGKGLFTKEIEQALLDGRIDFAVHSFKDVPVTMPLVDQSRLTFAAVPAREDVRDVLVAPRSMRLEELPRGARVGTSSLRRAVQLRAIRADLEPVPIRGNIDTRLRKLRNGEYDAIVLAMAGLKRAALYDPATMSMIEVEQMLPAAGQGALVLQCRRDDVQTMRLLSPLNDPATAACVAAERRLVELLGCDCHSPVAAYARASPPSLTAALGLPDGTIARAKTFLEVFDPEPLARAAFAQLSTRERSPESH